MMRLSQRLLGALAAILLASAELPAQQQTNPGQSTPGAVRERSRQALEYLELRSRIGERPETKPVAEDQTAAPAEPTDTLRDATVTLRIKAVEIDNSEILTSAELAAITQPLVGHTVSLADLRQAVAAINALYRGKGYFTAKAFLPPQKVEEGVVRVGLVEAHVGAVSVTGNRRTREGYVRRRLNLKQGDLFQISQLERDLHTFNATNDIAVRASLSPGSEFGVTDLLIEVADPSPVEGAVFADNTGTDSVGTQRAGLVVNIRNALGSGERVVVGGNLARDTEGAFASVDVPVNRSGTRLALSLDHSSVQPKNDALSDLDVTGDSTSVAARLMVPLATDSHRRIFLYFGYRSSDTKTRFDDVPIFESDVRAILMGADLQRADAHGEWYANAEFRQARKSFGGDLSFGRFTGSATRVQRLSPECTAVFRAQGQLAHQRMLPFSEQFQLGGQSTVRGFEEGLLSGDDGYFLSAEFIFPIHELQSPGSANPRKATNWSVFIDHGGALPFKGDDEGTEHRDFLTGAGLGLSFPLGNRSTGRVAYGFQLSDSYKDQRLGRVHFGVQYAF